ncbi:winged helix-turn-helix domain-containing protein [Streptomyces sp. TRM68416]|uniref:winged helix-turn-helix domain-containing protein n=1 Tax=Streptomyces sp. TRM68416 TaxID=2758412 RepID=UPI001661F281|nr:winged helix-turn-helix domain-containing protein [Streptomyces sp. TRM68416]MBD0839223.1 winged helix-turn-helix transcriptional regulator [Streptomyces sp. TRM68416]
MLRVHFSDADLGRTRLGTASDPLWDIAISLHRLQTRQRRWAHAEWYRTTRARLREAGLERAVRSVLLPLYPRAAYFPDFLTPVQAADGLRAGLEGILAAPAPRVREEIRRLDAVVGAPSWAPGLAERAAREEFVGLLRAYHDIAVAPYEDRIHARIEGERALRARQMMDGGVEGMLAGLGPWARWQRSVLCADYNPSVGRDVHLEGRGMLLVPSYFLLERPITFADPGLPPVLVYPLVHEASPPPVADAPLGVLLGRARAAVLASVAHGATTGEVARAVGVSASSASRHATALRDAGLVTTSRTGTTVLHTLTPVGAAVLRAAAARGSERARAYQREDSTAHSDGL